MNNENKLSAEERQARLRSLFAAANTGHHIGCTCCECAKLVMREWVLCEVRPPISQKPGESKYDPYGQYAKGSLDALSHKIVRMLGEHGRLPMSEEEIERRIGASCKDALQSLKGKGFIQEYRHYPTPTSDVVIFPTGEDPLKKKGTPRWLKWLSNIQQRRQLTRYLRKIQEEEALQKSMDADMKRTEEILKGLKGTKESGLSCPGCGSTDIEAALEGRYRCRQCNRVFS